MSKFFFSGSVNTKVDDKNRFVLPQAMRYGLVEDGKLEFVIALGLGGSLAIYRKSDIEKIVEKFREKQHLAKYQRFFTLFFSTLHHTTCDKLGRVVIPSILKKAAKLEGEIVVCGVLGKIEIWQKDKYEADLLKFMEEDAGDIVEEAFALLAEDETEEKKSDVAKLTPDEKKEYESV
ncbi:MAG: Transcriptional regulator MraZ [Chlamydiia bacterium]|nr:Transcriptional regulator MraZ [Chlamydiia bacterium]MCH9615031.1 Transcriptional regulator MraZ [Chlamydiia bacterium]MCH9629918.1 Transcriptional regulator MraZ [Chlamydiia bacterium]